MTDCLLLTGFHASLMLGGLGETHHGAGTDLHYSDTRIHICWLPLLHRSGQHYLIMSWQWFAFNYCYSLGFLKGL